MKASNVILAIIIGSITLLITAGAMQIRFTGHRFDKKTELQSKKIELPHFRYLVINDVRPRINITFGNQSEIVLRAEIGKEMPMVKFHLEGDTLYINKYFQASDGHNVFMAGFHLNVPQGYLQWIRCQNSSIDIRNYTGDVLPLILNKSNVSIQSNNNIGKLQIEARESSFVYTHSSKIDTLDLDLDRSKAEIQVPITKLQGQIKNESRLTVKAVKDFEFKKDNSSRLVHYD